MALEYNEENARYVIYFDCDKGESCNCNEKIIQLFNNHSTCEMDRLDVDELDHIDYNTIKDKINKKWRVKELSISLLKLPDDQSIFHLNVLQLLFYPDEIERLFIVYNERFDFGDVYFNNLKFLSISVYYYNKGYSLPHVRILPIDYFLSTIVEHCPNIKELELERTFEKGDESLKFIIETLIKLNENLIITLYYLTTCCLDYTEDDKQYIEGNKLERIDKHTILYKTPNVDKDKKIKVTLYAVCYKCEDWDCRMHFSNYF